MLRHQLRNNNNNNNNILLLKIQMLLAKMSATIQIIWKNTTNSDAACHENNK